MEVEPFDGKNATDPGSGLTSPPRKVVHLLSNVSRVLLPERSRIDLWLVDLIFGTVCHLPHAGHSTSFFELEMVLWAGASIRACVCNLCQYNLV